MSFLSRSSKGRHYKSGNYGSSHYQKKGILSNLFNIIASRSGSEGHYRNQYHNAPSYNQPQTEPNSITCVKCNSQIPAGSKFCLQCGEKVSEALFCMNCGEKLPPNARFCLKCGNKVGD
jgi:ribosomal protein L40E